MSTQNWACGGDTLYPVPTFLAVSLGVAAATVAQDIYFRLQCQTKDDPKADVVEVAASEISGKIRWLSPSTVRDAIKVLVNAGILIVVKRGGSAASSYKFDDDKAKHYARHPEEGAKLKAVKSPKPLTASRAPKSAPNVPTEPTEVASEIRPQFVGEICAVASEIRSVDGEICAVAGGIRPQTSDTPILEKNKREKDQNENGGGDQSAAPSQPEQSDADALAAANKYFHAVWIDLFGTPTDTVRALYAAVRAAVRNQFIAHRPRAELVKLVQETYRIEQSKNVIVTTPSTGPHGQVQNPDVPMTRPWRQGLPVAISSVPPSDKHGNVIPKRIGMGFNFDDIKRYSSGEYFIDQGEDSLGRPLWDWSKEKPKKITADDVIKMMVSMKWSKSSACRALGVDPSLFPSVPDTLAAA